MGLKEQMVKMMAKEAASKIIPMEQPKKSANWKMKLSVAVGSLIAALAFIQEFLK